MLIYRNLIVPAAFAAAARELCAAVHPAGAGMFTVPLSPTGELPATHWASTGLLEAVWAPALEAPAIFFGAAQHTQSLPCVFRASESACYRPRA